jgi:hypothetical protein
MTTKERWTVYPLLLLAIGLALRSELTGQPDRNLATISAEAIVCQELAILGDPVEEGQTPPIIVHAGRVQGGGGGRIEIRDARGIDSVAIGTSAESRSGSVDFFDEKGNVLGKLGPKVAQPATPPASHE